MIKYNFIIIIIFGILFLPKSVYAQNEEESAEISLEEVEDKFQENFYEALKQKGIENYDKAIDLFLECKQINPNDEVLDFEIGKSYIELKQYENAENYLLTAVEKNPDNVWYLEALFGLYDIQKNKNKSIEIATKLSKKNNKYKMYLINLYVDNSQFDNALKLLDELDKEIGTSKLRDSIKARIIAVKHIRGKINEQKAQKTSHKQNPLEIINSKIESYTNSSNYKKLLIVVNDAIENYPSQATFYYSKGYALNKLENHDEAIKVLLEALDYLIDDLDLENNIYKELMLAYQAMGNNQKVKEYEKKLKTGL